jgi:hypothetical protein
MFKTGYATSTDKPTIFTPVSAPAAQPQINNHATSTQQDPLTLFFSMLQSSCATATSAQPSSQIKDPEARMAKALEELRACPVKIPEGFDDRDAVLHAARFLGNQGDPQT